MSNEKRIIEECARALKAAKPFVVDGRPHNEAEQAETLLDSALELASNYLKEADPKADQR